MTKFTDWLKEQTTVPYERKRYSHDCQGRILEIRPGFWVVPYQQVRHGWYAVVVKATEESDRKSYPRGGYNIVVFDQDVETAIEHEIPEEENSEISDQT